MKRVGLEVARIASAAWVGAAALFVVTALREVKYPGFDSGTKDALALLRFPAYYAFGFTLVPAAIAGACASQSAARRPSSAKIHRIAIALLGVALAAMLFDYFAIYRPLADAIAPGRAKPADFHSYHLASQWVNSIDVGLVAVGAILLCWPERARAGQSHAIGD